MKSEVTLTTTVKGEARAVATALSDLRTVERLHPLLRAVVLEREEGALRVWRCDDRILGFPLTYFPEQRIDGDGLGYVSQTRQSGLTLTNAWRFDAVAGGTRITERLRFEGARPVVWFSARVGVRAHRGLFAAIEREFGVCK